jgi:hypothetical protein
MDTREQVAAANALIEWFNSQAVAPSDAIDVMTKVMAKVIVANLSGPTTAAERRGLDEMLDTIMLKLVHATNERLFQVRRS